MSEKKRLVLSDDPVSVRRYHAASVEKDGGLIKKSPKGDDV